MVRPARGTTSGRRPEQRAQQARTRDRHEDRPPLHHRGNRSLRGARASAPPPRRSATPTARWSSPSTNLEVPEDWSQVAADVLAQKYFRKAGVPVALKRVREKGVPGLPLALGRRRGEARRAARGRALHRRDQRRARSSTGWPAPGPTGAGRAATSPPRPTPAPTTTRCATCSRRRWARRTRRSGSTPACTGPTASTARGRGTSTSTSRRASSPSPPPPTSTRSRTPASSSRSATTSSTTAGSWTSGPARRGSSSTARAPAPTSPRLRAENERLAGGGKSSGLMSFLKIGDRAAGAIKSGGTTRRAAKMVICDMDHPDIEDFINWKVVEEQKVASPRRRLQDPPREARRHPRRHPRLGRRRGRRLRPQGQPRR